MDTLEINKIVGSLVGALLIYLGAQFFAEMILEGDHGHGDYAYSVEIEEESAEPAEEETIDVAAVLASGDPSRGAQVFRKCSACHKVEPGANGVGPHLYGVVGRDIGSVDDYSYSGALSEQGAEVWTPETLFAFLENPRAWAPGTSRASPA
jgi:Cytochrome c2